MQHALAASNASSSDLWHARFGHAHLEHWPYLHNNQMVEGMPKLQQPSSSFCERCVMGKFHHFPFKKDGLVRATHILQLVHSDVCEVNVRSHRGAKYYVSFIDDYCKFTWIFLMKEKSEVFHWF